MNTKNSQSSAILSIHKFYIFHNQDCRMLWLHFEAVFSSVLLLYIWGAFISPSRCQFLFCLGLCDAKTFLCNFTQQKKLREKSRRGCWLLVSPHRNPSPNKREQNVSFDRGTPGPWLETSRDFSIHVAFSAVTQCAFEVFISFSSFFRNTNHSQVKRQIATRWKENLGIPQKRLFIERHKSHPRVECVSSHVASAYTFTSSIKYRRRRR